MIGFDHLHAWICLDELLWPFIQRLYQEFQSNIGLKRVSNINDAQAWDFGTCKDEAWGLIATVYL